MDSMRRLFSKVRMAPSDEELGRRQSVYPADGRRSSQYPEEVPSAIIETITTHGSFKAPRGFHRDRRPIVTVAGRPTPNTGIYATVVDKEIKSKKSYKYFSLLINSCLGLQILVAAALTALGASNGSHATVTVFGAINTAIAGFLTYLNGSGLPNRLKYFQHEWGKVREYIEQRERDLSIDNSIDVPTEVNTIRQMFEEIRADVEANTPDRFVSVGNLGKTVAPAPALAAGSGLLRGGSGRMQRMDSGLSDAMQRMKEKAGSLQKEVGGVEKEVEAYGSAAGSEVNQFHNHAVDDIGKLKSRLQETMREIAHLEREVESRGARVITSREAEMEKRVGDKMKEIGDLEHNIESSGREATQAEQHEVDVRVADNAAVDAAGRSKATLEIRDPFREEKRDP